jgi:hypothetical protein
VLFGQGNGSQVICEVCGKTYASRQALAGHQRIHNNLGPSNAVASGQWRRVAEVPWSSCAVHAFPCIARAFS